MDTTNQGTQTQAGQGAAETQTTQQGTEQAQQQAAVTQQPQATTTATTTTAQSPSPEQITQWQQEAQRATQLEQNYKALQAEFTRTRQAMATLTGNANGQPPQEDPASQYVQNYLKAGYAKEDAEMLGKAQYVAVQPLIQQNQQLQAAIHGNAIVGDVLRDAWSQAPQAFSDPQILQSVEQVLRAEALRGNQINAEYALDLAGVALFRKQLKGNQTPPPAQQPAMNIPGQFPWASGFSGPNQQPAQQKQPLTPELQAADAALKARYGIQKQA